MAELEDQPNAEVSLLLEAMDRGDAHASGRLLELVYDDLRRIAALKLAAEAPGQTLQPTALVHEAYLRLVGSDPNRQWDHRGHFFAAAAEAMRRILVDNARRKQAQVHGGGLHRRELQPDLEIRGAAGDPAEVLAIHEALDLLAEKSPRKAKLVKLRYFLGMSMAEAANTLGIALGTAEDDWTYARAWLKKRCRP